MTTLPRSTPTTPLATAAARASDPEPSLCVVRFVTSRLMPLTVQKFGRYTDDHMAAAMIDRLAHHGYLLIFEGEGYRMKHALIKQR
ncbi:MAG: ATP-binding protein [Sulfobacillus sp.]